MPKTRTAPLWLLALTLLLSACAPIVRPEQPSQTDTFSFKPGERIGQTLVANFDGLEGVEVYLAPQGEARGQVTLHLREEPAAEEDLAVASLPAGQVAQRGFYRFSLPVQARSRQRYYYFELTFEGEGRLQVGRAPGEAYLDGAAYRQGAPVDAAQLAFLLDYAPRQLARGLAGEALRWVWYLLLAGFLFVLPGWALLDLAGAGDETFLAMRNIWARGALAAGAGLALYPLLFLWTGLAGLHPGRGYALLPGLAAAAWLARRRSASPARRAWRRVRSAHPADFALAGLLALLVFSRVWVLRTLEGPMWGDGMQHTIVTQLLLDHGGLFTSWQPYAPMETFTYHFGFHTAAALFAWLTGMEARFAALWAGQLLNILAALALYPLAWKIGGENRWAGTGAVLVAGLLSPMPAFYLNWGRYTQLAGQVILLPALYFAWEYLDRGSASFPRRRILAGAVLWGGLGLTHYRVLIMGAAGVAAYLLTHPRRWRETLPRALALAAAGGSLALPWYGRAFGGKLVRMFAAQLRAVPAGGNPAPAQAVTGDLALYLPPWGWVLLLLGAGVALWQRRRWAQVFALWWLLLLIAAYPAWLHLPGNAIVGYFTVLIAAYIPAGVFLGGLLALPEGMPRAAGAGLSLLILLAGVWGLRARLRDIAPAQYALLTRPDVRAAAWVQERLPAQARFLIDGFTAYGDTAAVGADGGWWLSALTGRAVSLPPLLYTFEADPYPAFRQDLLDLTHALREGGAEAPETREILRRRGITHVYIGQQQGRVNSPAPALRPADLLASPHYRPVYHEGRVWIFEVQP